MVVAVAVVVVVVGGGGGGGTCPRFRTLALQSRLLPRQIDAPWVFGVETKDRKSRQDIGMLPGVSGWGVVDGRFSSTQKTFIKPWYLASSNIIKQNRSIGQTVWKVSKSASMVFFWVIFEAFSLTKHGPFVG